VENHILICNETKVSINFDAMLYQTTSQRILWITKETQNQLPLNAINFSMGRNILYPFGVETIF
jgi:hypothetical protein